MQRHVILGDSVLGGNVDDLLSEIMLIGDTFNKWDFEVKSG